MPVQVGGGGVTFPVNIGVRGTVDPRTNQSFGQFTKTVDKTKRSVNLAANSFPKLAGAFTSLLIVNKVTQAFQAIIRPTLQLEMSMKQLETLTNASADALARYKEEAFRVAGITPYGPQEMVKALLLLRQATGSATTAMASLQATAGLAMASFGKMTTETSAKMVGEMMRSFSMTGSQAMVASDKVYSAAKSMGLQIQDLSNVMGRLGMAAVAGGQSFDEMLKAFVLARRVIPSSQRASTRLIRLMGEIGRPKARDALKQLGIEVLTLTGRVRPMGEIMLEMAERYQQSSVSVRMAMQQGFGQAAAKPLLAMLSQLSRGVATNTGEILKGRDAYLYLSKAVDTAGGSIKNAQEKYLETTASTVQIMQEGFEKLAVTIGDHLLPAIKPMANAFKTVAGVIETILKLPFVGTMAGYAMAFGGLVLAAKLAKAAYVGFKMLLQAVSMTMEQYTASTTKATAATMALSAASGGGAAAAGAAAALTPAMIAKRGGKWSPNVMQPGPASRMERMSGAIRGMGSKIAGGLKGIAGLLMNPLAFGLVAISGIALSKLDGLFQKRIDAQVKKNTDAMEKIYKETGKIPLISRERHLEGQLKRFIGAGRTLFFKDDSYERILAKQKEIIDKDKQLTREKYKQALEVYRLTVKGGKEAYHHIQLGTELYENAINKMKGLTKFEPPEAQFGSVAAFEKKLRAAGPMPKPRYETMRKAMYRNIDEVKLLVNKATKEHITPQDHIRLSNAIGNILVGAVTYRKEVPGVGVTKGLTTRMQKEALNPTLEMSSRDAKLFMQKQIQLFGGAKPTSGKMIAPGYVPSLGRGVSVGPGDFAGDGSYTSPWDRIWGRIRNTVAPPEDRGLLGEGRGLLETTRGLLPDAERKYGQEQAYVVGAMDLLKKSLDKLTSALGKANLGVRNPYRDPISDDSPTKESG